MRLSSWWVGLLAMVQLKVLVFIHNKAAKELTKTPCLSGRFVSLLLEEKEFHFLVFLFRYDEMQHPFLILFEVFLYGSSFEESY